MDAENYLFIIISAVALIRSPFMILRFSWQEIHLFATTVQSITYTEVLSLSTGKREQTARFISKCSDNS